jgi:hypothetical protein
MYSQFLARLTDEQFFHLIDGLSSVINPWSAQSSAPATRLPKLGGM